MARIDLVAIQERLAQQQPKPAMPVPAERSAPASAERTTPVPKARSATASAGTLRATTTMRAALPLKATNTRGERAEERARMEALRAQIDELNAEMVVAQAAAERALSEEQARAKRLTDRVDAAQRDLDAARADAVAAGRRADAADRDGLVARAQLKQAEAALTAERARADALRTTIDELRAEQALMTDMHARELAVDQYDAQAGQQVAAQLRRAEVGRKATGLLARLRAAWRGE